MNKRKDPERIIEHLKIISDIRGVTVCQDPKFIWLLNQRVATRAMRHGFGSRGLITDHDYTGEFLEELDPGDLKDYYLWSFVREPFDRAVSIGSMDQNASAGWDKWIQGLFERVLDSYVRARPDDNDTPAVNKWFDAKHHVPCSYKTHINGLPYLDYIGRYENLEGDWLELCNNIGITFTQPLIRLSEWKSNRTGQYRTDEAVAAVKAAYAADYELLY